MGCSGTTASESAKLSHQIALAAGRAGMRTLLLSAGPQRMIESEVAMGLGELGAPLGPLVWVQQLCALTLLEDEFAAAGLDTQSQVANCDFSLEVDLVVRHLHDLVAGGAWDICVFDLGGCGSGLEFVRACEIRCLGHLRPGLRPEGVPRSGYSLAKEALVSEMSPAPDDLDTGVEDLVGQIELQAVGAADWFLRDVQLCLMFAGPQDSAWHAQVLSMFGLFGLQFCAVVSCDSTVESLDFGATGVGRLLSVNSSLEESLSSVADSVVKILPLEQSESCRVEFDQTGRRAQIRLAWVQPNDLELLQRGAEIFLRVGSFRRAVALAGILYERTIVSGKLNAGVLELDFD